MEYKFRGYDAVGDKGWVYGDLVHDQKVTKDGLEPRVMVGGYEVVPDSVGLFTGMTDKNGVEIYEGDIVRTNGCEEFFEVIYDAPDFCLKKNSSGYRFLNHPENFEVVGNIHDNPELLSTK